MTKQCITGMLIGMLTVGAGAQTSKAGTKPVTYDVTITTEGTPYSGTMALTTAAGKVSGTLAITQPTAVTGTVAGTIKGREMRLDFPFRIVERKCDGRIAVKITMPAKPAEAKGTVSIVGCGRDETNRLQGTIAMTPAKSS